MQTSLSDRVTKHWEKVKAAMKTDWASLISNAANRNCWYQQFSVPSGAGTIGMAISTKMYTLGSSSLRNWAKKQRYRRRAGD